MSKLQPETLLRDPEVRAAQQKRKEEARKYLDEFECPSCHRVGMIELLRGEDSSFIKNAVHDLIQGSCRNCAAVVKLDAKILFDGIWGMPFDLS